MRTGSPLNAFFQGKSRAEFALFMLGDSLPVMSMDAERAARQILSAARRGQPEVVLTLPAKAAVRVHGLLPSTTLRVLAGVNRLLPKADHPNTATPGIAVRAGQRSRLLDQASRLNLAAAERFHQLPGPDDASRSGGQQAQ